MISLCAILGHDFPMSFGGIYTACCLRCGAEQPKESDPSKFYTPYSCVHTQDLQS